MSKMPRNSQKLPSGIDRHGLCWRVRISRVGFHINEIFTDLRDAIEFRNRTIADIRGKVFVDRPVEESTTLYDVLDRYLRDVTPTKNGARAEANRIKSWQREKWSKLPITSITSAQITLWRDEKIRQGKAPSTIYNSMNILSTVFKIARAEWSIRVDNPLIGIRRPPQSQPRVATPDDRLEKLLIEKIGEAGLEDQWLSIFFQLAAWTAMRQGEIRALKWRDIDFENHLIYVRAELPGSRKTNTRRDVPMLLVVESLLNAWLNRNQCQNKNRQNGWVFPSLKIETEQLSGSTATTAFSRFVSLVVTENPGIKPITFHDLRHWSCTRLSQFHTDALDLSKTTGHKSLKVLQRYYNPDPILRAARIRQRAIEIMENGG